MGNIVWDEGGGSGGPLRREKTLRENCGVVGGMNVVNGGLFSFWFFTIFSDEQMSVERIGF